MVIIIIRSFCGTKAPFGLDTVKLWIRSSIFNVLSQTWKNVYLPVSRSEFPLSLTNFPSSRVYYVFPYFQSKSQNFPLRNFLICLFFLGLLKLFTLSCKKSPFLSLVLFSHWHINYSLCFNFYVPFDYKFTKNIIILHKHALFHYLHCMIYEETLLVALVSATMFLLQKWVETKMNGYTTSEMLEQNWWPCGCLLLESKIKQKYTNWLHVLD